MFVTDQMAIRTNKVFLLCRCTRRDYAEDMFYNGNLYFNYPINWIGMGENGNEGQGDLYEGVYTNVVSDNTKRLRTDAETLSINGKLFLRSKSVVNNWPCLSFYSISELTEGRKEKESIVYDMAKDYIDSFSHGETFQSMLQKPLQERMSMVIITETGKFFRKIRNFLGSHGLVELQDYFMQPVLYRRKGKPFVYASRPLELFYKESQFKKQQELRIVLNPNNPKVLELLEDGHKIPMGSIEDMAMLKTNFYNGATIKINGHRISVEAADWHVMSGPLNEWEMSSLLGIMQAAYHTTTCVMDGETVIAHAFWVAVMLVLCSKYNIEVRHGEYVDGQDDIVQLICHTDDLDQILEHEKRDSYYYLRKGGVYKAPFLEKLLGGFPPGMVKINWV